MMATSTVNTAFSSPALSNRLDLAPNSDHKNERGCWFLWKWQFGNKMNLVHSSLLITKQWSIKTLDSLGLGSI